MKLGVPGVNWSHYVVAVIAIVSVLLIGTPIERWQKLVALVVCGVALVVVGALANLRRGDRR